MNRIPKELHLYWDGSPMSYLQALTAVSFHELNPDWIINLYIPKQGYSGSDRYIPDYLGDDYFHLVRDSHYVNVLYIDLEDYGIDANLHNILRSDIFRYHILYTIGGVWSDFDVIWLKPMDHFRNIDYHGDTPIEDINTVVSFIHGTGGGHSIGILIHCRHDPYMAAMVDLCKKVKPPYSHEVFGGELMNRNFPDLKSYEQFGNVVGARFETYYPYNIHPPNQTIQNLYIGEYPEPLEDNNVMCLHWYNGHVLSKQYVNNNGYKIPCTMTTLLKQKGYI